MIFWRRPVKNELNGAELLRYKSWGIFTRLPQDLTISGAAEPTDWDIAAVTFAGKFVATHVLLGVLLVPGGADKAIANIVGSDDRQELEYFTLSPDERAAMYEIVGRVECRRQHSTARATAFVIDGGRHVLTNAHAFKDGTRECTFSRKQSRQIIHMELDKAIFGTPDWSRTHHDDWAIVPLRAQLNTPIFKLGSAPREGEELFVVGVVRRGKDLDESKLVARRCTAIRGGMLAVRNDCDLIPGDSGSPYFARRNGILEIVAMHVAGIPETSNGKPFADSSPGESEDSYSTGFALEGPLRGTIRSTFDVSPSASLLKPFHDPNYKPLPAVVYDKPVFAKIDLSAYGPAGINRVIGPAPPPPRSQLSLAGMKLLDLSPDDQILYGIPDEIKGVLVSSVSARMDLAEGDVLVDETLERISKLHEEGTISLTVSVRKLSGQTERRALSLE